LSQITESARALLQWGHATVGRGAYRAENAVHNLRMNTSRFLDWVNGLDAVLIKARFWPHWAAIAKCSPDTALRAAVKLSEL